jgi:hypothetical protein
MGERSLLCMRTKETPDGSWKPLSVNLRLWVARLGAVVIVLLLASPATAEGTAPPPGDISPNVEFIANIPEMRTAIAVNFIGDTMFVSTTHGLYSYDISTPATPKLLAALPMYIWENEDMDVDPARKLVFISRDPRGFTTPATTAFPYGAVHIIDVSNPSVLRQVNMFLLPAGHTSTCVNQCRFLWTGGPAKAATDPADWGGRPIFGTDIRDPMNPVACPAPIDLGRNEGKTDYAHDVQVDADGVAWVSGRGGIRGYWTEGSHRNPLTGQVEEATACKPVPYGGGGTPTTATPSRFMHNSWRDVDATIPGEDDPATAEDETRGMVLYGTEENITSGCATSGRAVAYDLRGSLDGEGWKDIATTKFAMRALDTWTPQAQPGATGCASAHYLDDRGDGVVAYAFYGQGTRFLDFSDPKDIRQVGYYRPDGGNAWAPYFYKDLVVVADNSRGVDILRFTGGASTPTVPEPVPLDGPSAPANMSRTFGYLCPIDAASLTVR